MIKLHLGCGKRNFGPDWIHIDGGNFNHISGHDITHLNFEDNSVDLIYASHVIEYFDRDEIINILFEWKRVLKIGGVLRLAVPSFYDMACLYIMHGYGLDRFLGPLYGKMEMGDKDIYHKTVYDYESLKNILKIVGLNNIRRYDWRKTDHNNFDDHSQAYIPHMDKENGVLISLNVEAIK